MRLRYNQMHTTLATGVNTVATTLQFVDPLTEGGVNIPSIVAPDILAISFRDPSGALSDEVAHITAYTSGALTATVLRAQENTLGIAHAAGSEVSNTFTKADAAELTNQTAAELLTAIKTVDGAGSGLDADLLDGNSSAAFATAAQGAKVDFLAVTQAVDLDAIETRVNSLDAAVVLRGSWDASAGTFPGSGTAQAGDSYIVSVAGTVNAIVFSIGDRIVAILDNASTGTYAANWLKLDYTDVVLSVNGLTGAVDLSGTYALLDTTETVINVTKQFGADPTGATESSTAIAAALASIVHTTYSKQSVVLEFDAPPVGGFYRLTSTFDLTEFWNVTLRCPGNYDFQRQVVYDVDTDYSLFHWYGAAAGVMVLCDYTYGLTIEGTLSLNGRNLAGVGFALGATGDTTSNVKFFKGDVAAKRCTQQGIRVGDLAANGPDVFPIHFGTALAQDCGQHGVKVNSGNAGVRFDHLTCLGNSVYNLYMLAGEVSIGHYNGTGAPSGADIQQDSGGLVISAGWSDVSAGKLLNAAGPITRCDLTGVRHYTAGMTNGNTPRSIVYGGAAPLVTTGCYLYNSIELVAGNNSQLIDLGSNFVAAGATIIHGANCTSMRLGGTGGVLGANALGRVRLNNVVLPSYEAHGLSAAMVAGTLTINLAGAWTAAAVFQLTTFGSGANPGALRIGGTNPGVSFAVSSTNAGDTNQIYYSVFEP